MSVTAKLFMLGEDQAVELPEEFRFAGEQVRISKIGDMVVLEPLEMSPPADTEAVAEITETPDDPS
ncbi:MAG: AbrB/MazE/SpoVT family DNA-binding domain-containing protein [Pseudomonadota bacterium]